MNTFFSTLKKISLLIAFTVVAYSFFGAKNLISTQHILHPIQIQAQGFQFSENSIKDPALNGLLDGKDSGDGSEAFTNLEMVISRIIGGLTIVGSIFFVIYFMLASFTWVTAGGDAGKIQKSRDQMVQGVLGLIIIIIAYSVVSAIGTVIGINILNPSQQIQEIFLTTPGTTN